MYGVAHAVFTGIYLETGVLGKFEDEWAQNYGNDPLKRILYGIKARKDAFFDIDAGGLFGSDNFEGDLPGLFVGLVALNRVPCRLQGRRR